ncbi:unnamed protein product [Cuscuta epithymum]|uniref:Sororin C-terminal region domain-containing protein n=1 Tax=Cuscuta epithymum TaxID=186058 RepID=A0AAV0FC25_9ASTE|nr:unnamed protein product [Cuscuta epithymum]
MWLCSEQIGFVVVLWICNSVYCMDYQRICERIKFFIVQKIVFLSFFPAMSEESASSTTNSNKKYAKKRRSGKLSCTEDSSFEDFVKKQKAYFKEVDEFELQVEEASDLSILI